MLIALLIGCWLLVVLVLMALARAAAMGDRLLEEGPRLRVIDQREARHDPPSASGGQRVAL